MISILFYRLSNNYNVVARFKSDFVIELKFPERKHCFEGVVPAGYIIASKHPLPNVVYSQMHAGFEFDAIHRQSLGYDFVLYCIIIGDFFQTVVVYYSSNYVDESI